MPQSPAPSEPDPAATVTGQESLRRLILAQAHLPSGAAVLLFTSPTLAGRSADPAVPGDEGAPSGPEGDTPGDLGLVADTAAALGLRPDLELFSSDAYLLQSALGERLAPTSR